MMSMNSEGDIIVPRTPLADRLREKPIRGRMLVEAMSGVGEAGLRLTDIARHADAMLCEIPICAMCPDKAIEWHTEHSYQDLGTKVGIMIGCKARGCPDQRNRTMVGSLGGFDLIEYGPMGPSPTREPIRAPFIRPPVTPSLPKDRPSTEIDDLEVW